MQREIIPDGFRRCRSLHLGIPAVPTGKDAVTVQLVEGNDSALARVDAAHEVAIRVEHVNFSLEASSGKAPIGQRVTSWNHCRGTNAGFVAFHCAPEREELPGRTW